jgi:DNA-binding NtrC family response regulator
MPNNARDSSSVKNKTRLKILLIFDEQDITAVLKKGLEAHEFEVVAFNILKRHWQNIAPASTTFCFWT